MNKRDLSCVVWLNPAEESFEGGSFFVVQAGTESEIVPECGLGALFESATSPHGVRAVTKGVRSSLLAWLTYDLTVDEDSAILASLQPLSTYSNAERLFGLGPNSETVLSSAQLAELLGPLGLGHSGTHLQGPGGSHALEASDVRHFLALCYWVAFSRPCSLLEAGSLAFELLRYHPLMLGLTASVHLNATSSCSVHRRRLGTPRVYSSGNLRDPFSRA